MASSDFLNNNLASQCEKLAGEINKVYQRLEWALKNEIVQRLKRQVHQLAQAVRAAQDSSSPAATFKNLENAIGLVHELVPLLDLCLRKNLVSPDLQKRWVGELNRLGPQLEEWNRGC
jgi:hypothetical protein